MTGHLKLDDLQSYDDLFALPADPQREREQRRFVRKLLETDGELAIGGLALEVRTADISLGGISLTSTKQLAVGTEGWLTLSLQPGEPLRARVRVIHCFYSGGQAFKAGLEFLALGQEETLKIRAVVGE